MEYPSLVEIWLITNQFSILGFDQKIFCTTKQNYASFHRIHENLSATQKFVIVVQSRKYSSLVASNYNTRRGLCMVPDVCCINLNLAAPLNLEIIRVIFLSNWAPAVQSTHIMYLLYPGITHIALLILFFIVLKGSESVGAAAVSTDTL